MLVYGPRTDVRAGRCVRPSVSMSSLPDAPAAAALQEDFGRGQHHLSTLLEEGDVVAYQVGTWLVDNVEVGPGTPPRCLFCRVDYLQLNWSHNCEHGVIGGTRLLLDGGGDPSCVMALDESKEVSFGPEQLLARLPAEWSADAGTATLRCPMPGSLQHLLLSPPPPPPSPPSSPLSRQSRPPTMDACYSTAAGRPPRHEMALEVKPLHLPGFYDESATRHDTSKTCRVGKADDRWPGARRLCDTARRRRRVRDQLPRRAAHPRPGGGGLPPPRQLVPLCSGRRVPGRDGELPCAPPPPGRGAFSRRSLRGNCCGTSDRPLASSITRNRAASSPRRPWAGGESISLLRGTSQRAPG
jgi:hypothetical protein